MKQSATSLFALCVLAGAASGQFTRRASRSAIGDQPDSGCFGASSSEDGRYIVFNSSATTLVPGDTNGAGDVFVKDLRTPGLERVSVSSSGAEGDATSGAGEISSDGRYVVFWSGADNLVAGDTNGQTDIFVRDRSLGTTTRVSLTSTGAEANDSCYFPSMSADARFIVYQSVATNLVPNDVNRKRDIFLVDTATGAVELVSVTSSGTQANDDSDGATVSSDGTRVAFASLATNLAASDANRELDVFVRDRATAHTSCASVDVLGIPGNGFSRQARISADGMAVVFASDASNLVGGDTNDTEDVFVRHYRPIGTMRVSVDSAGGEADGYSDEAGISADGTRVSFRSVATNLVPGDTNGYDDVFLRDVPAGTTVRASVDDSGNQGNEGSELSVLSPDGRWVTFTSSASNLERDNDDVKDVYVRSLDGIEADVIQYGSGLRGEIGIPKLRAPSHPALGTDFTLEIDDSASTPILGLLLVGFARDSIAWKGGTLLVDWVFLVPLALVPPEIVLTAPIPDDDALNGFVVDLQAIELDPAAARGVSMTGGLELLLGY